MEEQHRSAIQANFSSLVEQTDLDAMVSLLYEKGVFSEAMIEPFQDSSKDQRSRKRQLYMDVQKRGPRAFRHLLDALTETGYWELVRALEPGSLPARAPPRPLPPPLPVGKSGDSEFLSIPQAKKMAKPANKPALTKNTAEQPPPSAPPPAPPDTTDLDDLPKFDVVKSKRFMDDDGKDIKLYPTRGRRRGVLVVFSYIKFEHEIEEFRHGVDVDCRKLKYLFDEMGLDVISFQNLTKQRPQSSALPDESVRRLSEAKPSISTSPAIAIAAEETLLALKNLPVEGAECVFVVVSSHGYARPAAPWLTDIRASDGSLVSTLEFVERLNNVNCPALRGVPKVFIFQTCRGARGHATTGAALDSARHGATSRAALRWPGPDSTDIFMAYSALPGYVSHRNEEEGSWYIQALCDVFAARAHDHHVEELFTLVDLELRRYGLQTSELIKWSFNRKLYLHPGLFEDDAKDVDAADE